MKHIPFAALPPAERHAVAEVLLRTGMARRNVCVSRTEPTAADEEQGMATVTGAGWFRSYAADSGWVTLLERDLLALRGAEQAQAPDCSLQATGGRE